MIILGAGDMALLIKCLPNVPVIFLLQRENTVTKEMEMRKGFTQLTFPDCSPESQDRNSKQACWLFHSKEFTSQSQKCGRNYKGCCLPAGWHTGSCSDRFLFSLGLTA